jgi:hypothetical protein
MWFVSVVDVLELNLIGLLTGLLGVTGTLFCDMPVTSYVAGCFIEGSFEKKKFPGSDKIISFYPIF